MLAKVLANLTRKKLIKAVKSVANKTRKVYMLAHLEPSREVTGGPWFTDNVLDSEFIHVLSQSVLRCIDQKGFATVEQVHAYILDMKISTVELSITEIQQIIDILVYDGKVEALPQQGLQLGGGASVHYRKLKPSIPPNHFTEIPCATCPVFSECSDNGIINPHDCEYLNRWMAL